MASRIEATKRIAIAIERDLYGRAAFDHWWDRIDNTTKREIRMAWKLIIAAEIDKLLDKGGE